MDEPQTHAAWIRAALDAYEGPLIRQAARYLGGDLDRARDVVQDTFLRLCQARRDKVEGHLEAWLFTVCRNRAIDVCRKEGRMGALDNAKSRVLASRDASPGDIATRRQAHRQVLKLVETLPADQQRAFRLKFREHKTYREISKEMDTSLGRVSKLITTAMATLRQQMLAGTAATQEVTS